MVSLKKPEETVAKKAKVSSKTKLPETQSLKLRQKSHRAEFISMPGDSLRKRVGFKAPSKRKYKNGSPGRLKPEPVFISWEKLVSGEAEVSSFLGKELRIINLASIEETQIVARDVYKVQPARQISRGPRTGMDSTFDHVSHSQPAEETHVQLEIMTDATSLDKAKGGRRKVRERLASLEISDPQRETMAKPVSETIAEPAFGLSSSLQTEKDGPKTVTDKIQRKQAQPATLESPVMADVKLDASQEKAQKASSAKAMSKKSIPSETIGESTDAAGSILQTGAPHDQPVRDPAVLDEQATARIDPATEAASEDKAANSSKQAKAPTARQSFKQSEFIVYPAHGVGQIIAIEEQEVAGFKLELFVISFVKDKMILKVPVPKAVSVRMRKLADAAVVKKSLDTLTGRARIKRTMWSRRAQEYEAKINSGDLISIAEVVRDLYRSSAQPEQSYSERQLYEAALDRMAREIAAVEKLSEPDAFKLLDTQLQKSPRRAKGEEPEAEEAEGDEDRNNIEEAA